MSAATFNRNTVSMLSDPNPTALREPKSRLSSFLMAGTVAGGVTLSLFLTMEYLIRIDKIELVEPNPLSLSNFIAEIPNEPEFTTKDHDIEKIEPATPPPAAPPLRLPQGEAAILGGYTIQQSVPDFDNAIPIIKTGVYRGPTTAIAIRRPVPAYPNRAAQMGLSGTCDVAFSLTAQGQPFDVLATCSNPIFKESAERAVSKAAFSPTKNEAGLPVITHNMVFPLEYRMD